VPGAGRDGAGRDAVLPGPGSATRRLLPAASARERNDRIADPRLPSRGVREIGHSPQIEEADKFQAVVRDFLHDVLADTANR
jgi:pimeloyl-ACP methyl ester carboxylesterase